MKTKSVIFYDMTLISNRPTRTQTQINSKFNVMTRLNFLKSAVITAITVIVLSSCGDNESTRKMTMRTTASEVSFSLEGTDKATVNWGDGKSETVRLRVWGNWGSSPTNFKHSYSTKSTHTITISGQHVGSIYIQSSELISLDVSRNTVLGFLFCPDNQINILDIGNITELSQLYCSENQLTSLDISNNLKLRVLNCRSNQLTSLDVSRNTMLESLTCANNLLTSLDVSKNKLLKDLHCANNQLTSLDLSRNSVLTNVIVRNNKLTADALNALFATLHNNTIMGGNNFPVEKQIYIGGNPGIDDCDHKIAESKGWTVWFQID